MEFILDPGLVLYLPFYERDGGSLMSKDANGHLATVTGALWTSQGRIFDGVDDIITIDPFSQVDSLSAATTEAWLKPNAGTFGSPDISAVLWKQGVLAFGGGWTAHKAQMSCWFTVGGWTGSGDSSTSIDDGNWHHLAGVYDGAYLRVYVDGVQENSNNVGAKIIATAADKLGVGARKDGANPADYELTGILGEARIYSRALTSLEIQHNYLVTRWRYV